MKKILALMMALCLIFSLAACGGNNAVDPTEATESAASDLAEIKANGEMVIGYTIYAPMNYEDENGELTGFDTEFAEAVCEKLGVEPKFVIIDWDNKFLELETKGIDCIWNGMTITDEAKNNASVSNPYVKNAQVVVMDKDAAANYTTTESLAALSFAAEAGSAGESAVEEVAPDADYTAVPAQTDALLEVVSGASDACVIDITMANAMTGEGTSYDSLGIAMELNSEEYGVAFRADSDVTAEFNKIMAELMEDGTLDALAAKYNLTLVK